MTYISCIIVDDERLARVELKALLIEVGGCHLLAQAADAIEAVRLIESLRPDLLFLDINMPGVNGFELLANLKYCPLVVFVTAYDQFAIKAFEVHALDYLMKPVPVDRLRITLQHVRQRLNARPQLLGRLFVSDREGGKFLELNDLYLIRADDHYLRLYHSQGMELFHQSLSAFAERLPEQHFFRINRSEIIQIAAVKSIQNLSRGRYELSLPDQETVVVSEKRSVVWRRTFGNK